MGDIPSLGETGLPAVNEQPARKPLRAKRGRQDRLPENLRELARIDRRSLIGRDVSRFRAALVATFDGSPGAIQAVMIEQACQLRMRIKQMDLRFADTGAMSGHDTKTYLAWQGALTRLLREIEQSGGAASKKGPPTLAELHELVARGAGD